MKDGMIISDKSAVKMAITGLYNRIETSRGATSPAERRKNIDTVKGLMVGGFVKADVGKLIYGNHAIVDIESTIRRSEIELSDYELKQGILMLSNDRKMDASLIDKVLKTLCAIANNGPQRAGKVLIGVTDKDTDAARVKQLDGIDPRKIGKRYVVGVVREANVLKISVEDYYTMWKDAVKNSALSPALRDSILSHIDYNSFVVVTI